MLVIVQIIYVMYKGGLPLVCHCLARKEPGIIWQAQGRTTLELEHFEGPSFIVTTLQAEYLSLTFLSFSYKVLSV